MGKTEEIKIIFIGTPEFAVPTLQTLIANRPDASHRGSSTFSRDYSPIAVITEPDRPAGRNRKITPPPVKIVAQKYKIPVFQPTKIKNLKFKIKNLQPDLIIVCAYGQIIPKIILDIPKYGVLNIHPSLLPKYRGATPIQTAILNGDKETGVTIIKMDEKMDHGPIVASTKFQITNSKLTYPELAKKLADLGAKILIKTLPDYLSGKIKPKPQDDSKATYTKLLKKENGLVDWKKGPIQSERQIRAYYPWPGSYFISNNLRFIIQQAHLSGGKLVIDKIQSEGKQSITFAEFARGYSKELTALPKYVKI